MNTLIVVLSVIAAASAGHLGGVLVGPGTHGSVLQAPSAHSSIVGPDGSQIVGSAHGAALVAPALHGGSISASVTPGHIAYTAPVVAHGYAHGYGHAYGHGYGAAVVAGPAGTITTHGVHGAYAYPHAAVAYAGAHEGQYIPSGLENLYDDGSYRAEHHYAHDGHYYHY